MRTATWDRSWLIPRHPAPRRSAAAAASLAVSLLIHFLVIGRMPPIRLPGPPLEMFREPEPRISIRPFPLDPVAEPAVPRSPARFHPDSGDLPPASSLRPAAWDSPPDPLLLQPAMPPAPLPAESAPLMESPVPAPLPAWEPRAERMEIDRILVPPELAARPRRVEPAVPRTEIAPDLTLPVPEWPAAPDARLEPAPVPGAMPPAEAPGPQRPAAGPAAGPPPDSGDWSGRLERIIEETALPPPPGPETELDRFLSLGLETHRPHDEPEALYFRVTLRRAGQEALPVIPKDLLLIQDVSQSMTQALLDRCKEGLQRALSAALNPGDRFNVISFRDETAACFEEWTLAGPVERARAAWFLEQMESWGRTDLFGSFAPVLAAAESRRPSLALVVSDGRPTAGLTDDVQVIESFSERNRGRVPVFTFGAGPEANRFLLDFLSHRNRGDSRAVSQPGAVPGEIEAFARELSRPVLFGVSARFLGVDETRVFPRSLTPLFLDRPLVLIGRVAADAPSAAIRITGIDAAGRRREMIARLDWSEAAPAEPGIVGEWVRMKQADLIGEHIRSRDPRLLEALRDLSDRYGLPVPYRDRLGIPADADGEAN